jgi:hypothetical protein
MTGMMIGLVKVHQICHPTAGCPVFQYRKNKPEALISSGTTKVILFK